MAILQPIIDLAEICYAHGLRHVVLSPGSRSAALTLAFSRHGGFQIHPVMDERSAGFIALGMAQQLKIPVVVLCTSGSAAYNLAPAIAEAYFQHIPLLILTADRPKEWIHQHDGQTIYQSELYGKHVKKSYEFSSDYGNDDVAWSVNRIGNDAINLASALSYGPVHINVPIREPFYPTGSENLVPSEKVRIVKRAPVEKVLSTKMWHELLNEWDDASKILIVGGQHPKSDRLNKALSRISEELDVPVVGDSISNLEGSDQFIYHQDLILLLENSQELAPDLLVTYGLSLMSKELKTFLRNHPAVCHWHIGEDNIWTDPIKTVTRQLAVSDEYFFENLFEKIDYQLFVQNSDSENDSSFLAKWLSKSAIVRVNIENYLLNLSKINDLTSIDIVIKSLKSNSQLHIGNSMPIRYVNALGKSNALTGVFCNRGTSGIDGCVSTTIGAAMVNNTPTVLLVGDVAFLYDRNGLLINTLPSNLKIIVLNNGGGNIFRMIDGPAKLPELGSYFETKHGFNAKRTAEDSGLFYIAVHDLKSLHKNLTVFLDHTDISLMEIFTDPAHNADVWKGLKSRIREIN
ncbi:2-succinyl-5-enolpyruvyl-6-hydroxy-3-cyclohexene-1-carboxylic-acid synthase [Dyadobacter psychrotolerans]|uniref:2-succinyl-5-enolpyruvyl-6-hydroxy-3-cyclohexene-1-carboxylate synthase n=1 Tax=Dyadobacter psychrotolerans TaxID=2541721 RepID=A0A4R5DTK1_9BACT|nr:2-succinyl-5-enolpyruvyl-6-hydroxy-3-cyclohexene-1-carboxylic-acid synthase [Dyadobacter psychrotolerans]TDE17749.1 2-succinyl-5-enolpyruvyl-6-hydroxy-3-cyclohexene-1-carboxylic-acid synthase [Dyadobacter psychrotolerans]